MASAGRILILPKGNYKADTEYEMLDLVFHGGASWIAKKIVKGVEPSDASSDYWMKMCESMDLTEILQRIAQLEAQMVSTISLDDIDLEPYALKTELTNYATKADLYTVNLNLTGLDGRLDTAEPKLTNLTTDVNNLKTSVSSLTSSLSGMSGVKFYTGTNNRQNTDNVVTFNCNFPPKLIIALGKPTSAGASYFSYTIIIPEKSIGLTLVQAGSMSIGSLSVSTSGNNVTITHTDNVNMAPYYTCNSASMTYPYICIG